MHAYIVETDNIKKVCFNNNIDDGDCKSISVVPVDLKDLNEENIQNLKDDMVDKLNDRGREIYKEINRTVKNSGGETKQSYTFLPDYKVDKMPSINDLEMEISEDRIELIDKSGNNRKLDESDIRRVAGINELTSELKSSFE